MKIIPRPQVLEAYRTSPLGITRALGELLDNAIDASSSNIAMVSEPKKFVITDDGVGCSDMEAMFTLGDHRPHQGVRGLGRYGIGFKEAALWFWGTTFIKSVRGGRRYEATVKWDKLARSAEWDVDEPVVQAAPHEPSGTSIVFAGTDRRLPSGKELEALVNDLGFLFTPALKRGVRITVRRERAQPMELQRAEAPPLQHVVDGTILAAGREVRVHAGVVEEGIANPRAGMHYVHRHRVIMPTSGLGCGTTSTNRLFGWVILGEQWELTKNKDDITAFKEELGEAVRQFIQPVLDVAGEQAEILEVSGLEADLTQLLRQALGGAKVEKERRDPGEQHGAVAPKETSRARGAVKRQPGNRLPGRIDVGRLRVEFGVLDEHEGIGRVDIHGNRVQLALNHILVTRLRTGGTESRSQLLQLALSLVIHQCVIEPDSAQQLLPTMRELDPDKRFRVLLGRFMGQIESA